MSKKIPSYIKDLKMRWADCLNIQYSLDIAVSKRGLLYDPLGYYLNEDDIIRSFTESVIMDEDFSDEEAKILEWNTGIQPCIEYAWEEDDV